VSRFLCILLYFCWADASMDFLGQAAIAKDDLDATMQAERDLMKQNAG
jgi:hypothetical protein